MTLSFDDFQTQVNAFGILEGSTEIKAYPVVVAGTDVLYEARLSLQLIQYLSDDSWCFVGVFTKITGKGDSLLNAFADYITQKSQLESSKEN